MLSSITSLTLDSGVVGELVASDEDRGVVGESFVLDISEHHLLGEVPEHRAMLV